MAYKHEIIVPTHYNTGKEIPLSTIYTIRGMMTTEFCGYSEYCGRGGWRDGDGREIVEDHTVFVGMAEENRTTQTREIAAEVKRLCEQDTVLMMITQVETMEFV
jgi:hypothetical protein